jgi:energy-coupling factor transport system substrate-specific component
MCTAAIFACIFSFIWGFVRGGYTKFTPMYILGMFIVRVISSILFAGVISKLLAEKLAKTGALSGYKLGQEEIDE